MARDVKRSELFAFLLASMLISLLREKWSALQLVVMLVTLTHGC